MRLLLDTHALYWYTTGAAKLSLQAQAVIQDATNDVFLSPASLWEMALKVGNGKWIMNQSFEAFVDLCLNHTNSDSCQFSPHTRSQSVDCRFQLSIVIPSIAC